MIVNQNKNSSTKYTVDELYRLVPSVYRQRDEEQTDKPFKPLYALLSMIAEQLSLIEDDIQNLYENWFIETCDPWVIPYIGDLLGTFFYNSDTVNSINRRSFVANTISYRRRKGTVLVLEQIAKDMTGWGAKAVEFFQLLEDTQYLNHLRLSNLHTPDIRNSEKMELINTPFDSVAHTAEIRNIQSGRGYYNIPNIGIFLWRLESYPVIDAPASQDSSSIGNFKFDSFGFDTQLFNHPSVGASLTQSAKQTDLATPISRLNLYYNTSDYYADNEDDNKSIKIKVNDKFVPIEDIVVCDLTNWDKCSSIVKGQIGIDPKLGRISFSSSYSSDILQDVKVSYYYGFSSKVGAGFYPRPEVDDVSTFGSKVYAISKKFDNKYRSIQSAFDKWNQDGFPKAIFKVLDSEVYTESIDLSLPINSNLQILAESEERPIIKVNDTVNNTVNIDGAGANLDFRSNIVFDGFVFDCPIVIQQGNMGDLVFRQCTLIPRSGITSLVVNSGTDDVNNVKSNDNINIILDHTITGPIDSSKCSGSLQVFDSIIDGQWDTSINCYKINILNSTVFGKAKVVIVDFISNSIFTSPIFAKRRQTGCIRFSYIPEESKVPRRYRCQPLYSVDISDLENNNVKTNMMPQFTSMTFGTPGYAQLHIGTKKEIFEGADNGNEMGVFNQLYQASRIANLKSALVEYSRFGLEIGMFNIT